MRKRLLALVFVAGALAIGPATAASADSGTKAPANTSASANAGTVSGSLLDGRVPAVTTFGRYWS